MWPLAKFILSSIGEVFNVPAITFGRNGTTFVVIDDSREPPKLLAAPEITCAPAKLTRQTITAKAANAAPTVKPKSLGILTYPPGDFTRVKVRK